jgi:hypothetical protein
MTPLKVAKKGPREFFVDKGVCIKYFTAVKRLIRADLRDSRTVLQARSERLSLLTYSTENP